MDHHRITGSLTPENQQKIKEAIATIEGLLPFLTGLTALERRRALKLGNKSRGFLDKCLDVAAQNPQLLPRSFDPAVFSTEVQFFKDVEEISIALTRVAEQTSDTALALGSDLFHDALVVYKSAKIAGKEAGLKGALSDLGMRFAKSPRNPTPSPAPTEAART